MKKYFGKMICILLIGGMACFFGGCSNKEENNTNSDKEPPNGNIVAEVTTTEEVTTEEPEEEKQVLTVVTDRVHLLNTKLAEYKAEFEEENENVEIQFQVVENYESEAEEMLESGEYGDVLLIPEFINRSELATYFEPLGTVEELSEDYDEKYLQNHTVNDMVYGLPRYVHVYGVAYNEIVFSKAGIIEFPRNPGYFLETLKKIRDTQPDVTPYYTGYREGEWLSLWQPHVWSAVEADADYRNNGIVLEDNPFDAGKSNYVVHKLLYDIVDFGLCESFEENMSPNSVYRLLNRGDIGCMMMSSEYLRDLQIADVNPDDIAFMPFPYEKDGVQYVGVESDYSYAINKNSANKEIAQDWIKYMLQDSGFAKSEGTVSICKDATLPDVLSNFGDAMFIVNNPATDDNTGRYEELNELSGIYLDSDVEKGRLIQSALGETDELFYDIMEDWNIRWNNARTGEKYNSEESTESQESME